jgi:ribosomal protein L29
MNYSDIQKKTDAELAILVNENRETLRQERFKDKFTRKASVIKNAKQTIAQALTELTSRRRNQNNR